MVKTLTKIICICLLYNIVVTYSMNEEAGDYCEDIPEEDGCSVGDILNFEQITRY